MTKPIVSTAIMQLIENNQISLDDNVDLYIPELKNLKYNLLKLSKWAKIDERNYSLRK